MITTMRGGEKRPGEAFSRRRQVRPHDGLPCACEFYTHPHPETPPAVEMGCAAPASFTHTHTRRHPRPWKWVALRLRVLHTPTPGHIPRLEMGCAAPASFTRTHIPNRAIVLREATKSQRAARAGTPPAKWHPHPPRPPIRHPPPPTNPTPAPARQSRTCAPPAQCGGYLANLASSLNGFGLPKRHLAKSG
jgi:hypothetical protein